MKKMSNKFHQGGLTIILSRRVFAGMTLKLGKSWPRFFKLQSLSIPVIRSYRRQKTFPPPKHTVIIYWELFLLSMATVVVKKIGKARYLWILARFVISSQSSSFQLLSVMLHDPYCWISLSRGFPFNFSISSLSKQDS